MAKATAAAPAAVPTAPVTDGATAAAPADDAVASTTHTYPDGTQVVGRPPWPKLSPKQRDAEAAEANRVK